MKHIKLYENFKSLAPNGKPTNLTTEQYTYVRTSDFKNFFGDWENSPETSSKVLDENGEPLVCNHSSRESNIETFYGNRIFRTKESEVKPIWFSYEGIYANDDEIFNTSYFLNIRKLFRFDNEKDLSSLFSYYKEVTNTILPDYDYNYDWEAQENLNLPAYIYEMGYTGYIFADEYSVAIFNTSQAKKS